MAALVVDNIAEFDLDGLRAHIEKALPPYARPLFLRFQTELEATSTFKPKKSALVAEGFDPFKVHDPLYFDDRAANVYRKLDAGLFDAITAGEKTL